MRATAGLMRSRLTMLSRIGNNRGERKRSILLLERRLANSRMFLLAANYDITAVADRQQIPAWALPAALPATARYRCPRSPLPYPPSRQSSVPREKAAAGRPAAGRNRP